MTKTLKPLAIFAFVVSAAFMFIDWHFQQTIKPAHDWPASEAYGPLGYFQALTKWVAFVLTAVLCWGVLSDKR